MTAIWDWLDALDPWAITTFAFALMWLLSEAQGRLERARSDKRIRAMLERRR